MNSSANTAWGGSHVVVKMEVGGGHLGHVTQ
jgi:hypothetical protein